MRKVRVQFWTMKCMRHDHVTTKRWYSIVHSPPIQYCSTNDKDCDKCELAFRQKNPSTEDSPGHQFSFIIAFKMSFRSYQIKIS